jgi:hypothetical protein
MRLADHMLAEVGGQADVGGIFTKTCEILKRAERFELSDDVARAGYNLTKSKPTSLIGALPLCRAPYPVIWLEWRGGLTTDMVKPELRRDQRFAPDPLKQGVLIETDESGQRGTMTFAWLHRERPERIGEEFYSAVNISPLGCLFNWDENGNVFDDAERLLKLRYPTKEALATPAGVLEWALSRRWGQRMTDADARQRMETTAFKDWGRHAGSATERAALLQLERHARPWIVPNTHGMFRWCADNLFQRGGRSLENFLNVVVRASWEPDIEGEPPFADTVVAMMNSRNAIEHRPVDLSGLNKQRAKRGRQLFLPYQTTHLRLSQAQTRAFRAGLLSREDAGRHRVRGHFKIRKTGIYWWHPFFRGDPNKPVQRQEYQVET